VAYYEPWYTEAHGFDDWTSSLRWPGSKLRYPGKVAWMPGILSFDARDPNLGGRGCEGSSSDSHSLARQGS